MQDDEEKNKKQTGGKTDLKELCPGWSGQGEESEMTDRIGETRPLYYTEREGHTRKD